MWWRAEKGGKAYDAMKGDGNRAAFRALVESGQARGILAFAGKTPVAWCTFGPRTAFPRLDRTRAYQRDDTAGIWSIPCFFILKDYRRQGVATQLLACALAEIRNLGGKEVEAYPVPLTKAGESLPAVFAFTGPLPLFEAAGFEVVQRTSYSRPLVRLRL